ncbi:MAG: UxaA family hydrolase, partial [Cetobacterium sp.]
MKEFIKINERDNVLIVLRDYSKAEKIVLEDKEITILEDVLKGHKIALQDIAQNEDVIKYGMPIGHALSDIRMGEWIHTHNTKTNLKDLNNYSYSPEFYEKIVKTSERKINVYKRKNGDVGIRNELWIVPTVGCVNGIAQRIKEDLMREIGDLKIDNINVLTHNYGCSQLGEDHLNTRTILQNTVKHPNAGGVLVLGLGCENNQVAEFQKTLGEY